MGAKPKGAGTGAGAVPNPGTREAKAETKGGGGLGCLTISPWCGCPNHTDALSPTPAEGRKGGNFGVGRIILKGGGRACPSSPLSNPEEGQGTDTEGTGCLRKRLTAQTCLDGMHAAASATSDAGCPSAHEHPFQVQDAMIESPGKQMLAGAWKFHTPKARKP